MIGLRHSSSMTTTTAQIDRGASSRTALHTKEHREQTPETLPTIRKRRADAKIDLGQAVLMLLRGISQSEVASHFGVSKQAMSTAIKPLRRLLKHPEVASAYRAAEADLLDAAKVRVLSHMLDSERLATAAPNHLAFVFAQLNTAGRLARGESTANVQTLSRVIIEAHSAPAASKAVPQAVEAIDNAKDSAP